MFKQLMLSMVLGLCIILHHAQSYRQVREYILERFLHRFNATLACNANATLESFSYDELRLRDMTVKSSDGKDWHWQADSFSISFSWLQLIQYGTLDLEISLQGVRIYSAFFEGKLAAENHLYQLLQAPQEDIYTFLREITCRNVSLVVQDKHEKRDIALTFDARAKKIDNRFKAAIDLYDGSLHAYDRELFKQLSGSLQLDSFDGQPSLDLCVKGAASFELPQLGAEIMPCYVSGSWHHNCGTFSLKNVDHSFAIDPILIRYNNGLLDASLEAKLPLSYIVHMWNNDTVDDRLRGACSVQAKMQIADEYYRYAGTVSVQRITWCDTEIGSLAKIMFEKREQSLFGSLYLQRTSGANFTGEWSYDQDLHDFQAHMKNNVRLTFSPKHDWQILPDDLSIKVTHKIGDGYHICYEGKAKHIKAQHVLSSAGNIHLYDERLDAVGSLDEYVYELYACRRDGLKLQHLFYNTQTGENLISLMRGNDEALNGSIDFRLIKEMFKKHMHYDLQGEGLLHMAITPQDEAYHLKLHLHEGTIRLPRTYNFMNGFDCEIDFYPEHKRCVVSDLLCTLHDGVVMSKKMDFIFAQDLSPRFIYAPLLIDHCLLNLEKELFAVVSGAMLLSKRQDSGTCLSGTVIIDRAQLKENLFSHVFQKNMRSFTRYPFTTHDDDMTCDIAVKTKYPVRVQTPFLETDARVDLHVRNNLRDPDVTGSVHLSGGFLQFPYKPLYITKGSLRFLPGKLEDPLIELEAKNMVKKNNIRLQVAGSLQNHHVTLESSPTLTEEQIVSLLLVGSQEESLNIVMPALIMQNIKSMLFGYDQSSQMSHYFGKLFKPFKSIHLVPSFIDRSGRGGLRGAIEIDLSDRCRALIQKNFSLTEDTRFELEYLFSDDISIRATRDIRRDLIAEVEMRYKFGN